MDKKLLGQILASVVLGAAAAGQILVNDQGHPTNADEIQSIIGGFLQVWFPKGEKG